MGIVGLLNQTCDIYRPSVSYDSMGGPTENLTLVDSNIRCRIQQRSNTLLSLIRGRDDVGEYIGFFEYGTDILQGDKVLFNGTYLRVVSVDDDVAAAEHHVEVYLTK